MGSSWQSWEEIPGVRRAESGLLRGWCKGGRGLLQDVAEESTVNWARAYLGRHRDTTHLLVEPTGRNNLVFRNYV
jgi:hypothetical protein